MENVDDIKNIRCYTDSYYSIAKLKEIEKLSNTAITACRIARFDNLMDIIEFYKKVNSFIMVSGCGIKTNDELIRLCEKYKNHTNPDNIEEQTKIKENKNFTIEELKDIDRLSEKAVDVCKKADLKRLRDIFEYYRKNWTFSKINDCGSETNKELINLCKRYFYYFLTQDELKENKIIVNDGLSDIKNISERAINVCRDGELHCINDIIDFYKENKSFFYIRNCGHKTNKELINLCIKHQYYLIITEGKKEEIKLKEILCFNTGELILIENLSPIIVNLCLNNDLNNLQDIINYYVEHESFLEMRNCDKSTNDVLVNICYKYIQMNLGHLPSTFACKTFIDKISNEFGKNIQNYISDFNEHYENKSFKLLKIIELIIFNSNYFDDINKNIIKSIYQGDGLTLQEIAEANSLTKERVRQRAEKISRRFLFLEDIIGKPIKMFWNFANKENIKLKDDIFIVDASVVEKINNENGTNFRIDFIERFLALCNLDYNFMKNNKYQKGNYFLRKTYETNEIINFIDYIKSVIYTKRYEDKIIKWEDFLLIKVKYSEKDFTSLRLLKKKLKLNLYVLLNEKKSQGIQRKNGRGYVCKNKKVRMFDINRIDFDDLLNYDWTYDTEINNKIKIRIEDYRNNVEQINKTYENKKAEEREKLYNKFLEYLNIFKIIAMNEFGLQFENETILIKRNTPKTKAEYIIEILNKFDRPMDVTEMFAEFSEKEPGIFRDKDAVRSTCQKLNDVFYFGRSSIYGLKKWEKEKENLKGGSIRKMVEEYLRNEKTPRHIDNITEYVNKYRNTNSKNVLTSLKSMKTNTFEFFEGRYVGLSDEYK